MEDPNITHTEKSASNSDPLFPGDEPMTPAQAARLKVITTETGELYQDNLTNAEAAKLIDLLTEQVGLGTPNDE